MALNGLFGFHLLDGQGESTACSVKAGPVAGGGEGGPGRSQLGTKRGAIATGEGGPGLSTLSAKVGTGVVGGEGSPRLQG